MKYPPFNAKEQLDDDRITMQLADGDKRTLTVKRRDILAQHERCRKFTVN